MPYLGTWFGGDESGASRGEYARLVALIAVVCIVAVTILGNNASSKFSSVRSSIQWRTPRAETYVSQKGGCFHSLRFSLVRLR
jgi:Flp pilus assembly pilin Flp